MNPWDNGLNKVEQNGRGKRTQISRLLRGFAEAIWRLLGLSYTVWQRKWQCVMI